MATKQKSSQTSEPEAAAPSTVEGDVDVLDSMWVVEATLMVRADDEHQASVKATAGVGTAVDVTGVEVRRAVPADLT